MSNIFGKKQVLLATLIVALGVAVYLNYYFSNQSPVIDTGASVSDTSKNMGDAQYVGGSAQSSEPGDKADYFSQARKNREDARAQSLDLIKEMMNDVKATDAIKKQALEKTEAVAAAIEQESKIESLNQSQGLLPTAWCTLREKTAMSWSKRTVFSPSRRFKSPRLSPPSRRLSHKILRYPT